MFRRMLTYTPTLRTHFTSSMVANPIIRRSSRGNASPWFCFVTPVSTTCHVLNVSVFVVMVSDFRKQVFRVRLAGSPVMRLEAPLPCRVSPTTANASWLRLAVSPTPSWRERPVGLKVVRPRDRRLATAGHVLVKVVDYVVIICLTHVCQLSIKCQSCVYRVSTRCLSGGYHFDMMYV